MKDNSSKVKVDVCSMSIKRNAVNGVTLKIKSPMFANFFKEHETFNTSNTVKVNGLQVGEKLKRTGLSASSPYYRNFNIENSSLMYDGDVNLGFLAEERIADGVEFSITGRYSKEALESFKTQFKNEITKFYIDNLQSVTIDLDISVMRDSE